MLFFISACSSTPSTITESDFSTHNATLAIQLSSQPVARGPFDRNLGYMVLSDDSGSIRTFDSGMMFGGQPLWTSHGLFFGGPSDEFIVNDQGLQRISRDIEPHGEFARYEEETISGFVSFYNGGDNPEGYKQPVVVGNAEGNESIDIRGIYTTMGACGSILYAVTDTALAPNLAQQAQDVFRESQDTSVGETSNDTILDILVQVYPVESSHDPTVLAAFEKDRNFERAGSEITCRNSTIYIPFFHRDHPDAQKGDGKDPKAGHGAIQAWDVKAHTRTIIPLVHEDGSFLRVTEDEMLPVTGRLIDGDYRLVTFSGQVYSIDLDSGLAEHLHTFDRPDNGGIVAMYEITDNAVYRLDNGQDIHSPLDFSRYVFDTGQHEHLFDVDGLASYRSTGVTIQGFAVNPEWDSNLH